MALHQQPSTRGRATVLLLAMAGLLGCTHSRPSLPRPADDARKSSADAVSVVDAEDFDGVPAVQVEELLEGRVAGVQVMRAPGGGISVRIRGQSSILGNSEPLYVVDGMPVQVTAGRGLDWLNPGDIKRIEILKDASATSMYGMRGANGVVLITTRRGR